MTPGEKSLIVCPACFAAGAAQRTTYVLLTNLYDCPVHGPVVTDEALPRAVPMDRQA